MSIWVSGPICGVDNCRSRLWRNADGSRVCQYGHVMEGDFEINDEQEENFVPTRRLNLRADAHGFTVAQKHAGNGQDGLLKKVYGAEARTLYLQCLQCLLKEQLANLLKLGFYDISKLEPVVKLFWIRHLTFGKQNIMEGTSSGDKDKGLCLPKALDLICIIYWAVFQNESLPLYLCDVVEGIKLNKFAYIKALHSIPRLYLERLPSFYLNSLEPYKFPLDGELCERVLFVGRRIVGEHEMFNLGFDYFYPLVYRIFTKKLLIPTAPKLFYICIKLADTVEPLPTLDFGAKLSRFPEIVCLAFMIFTIKVYFLNWNDVDFETWMKAISDHDLEEEFTFAGNDSGSQDMLNWSDSKVDKYYDWIFENVLPEEDENEIPLMKKKLYQLFDTDNSLNCAKEKTSHYEENNTAQLYYLTKITEASCSLPPDKRIMRTKDAALLEDKLFHKFSQFLGVPRKVLIDSYEFIEGFVKNSISI